MTGAGTPNLAELVAANLKGQKQAKEFIEQVRTSYPDPDALYAELLALLPEFHDIEALTVTRGFLRIVQKRLESRE
ncbi:hypothetical protein [Noviherbaspirillum malthae]|uniref:hypothetical protein n=1 Tax=Noviherbaspirillum malthae TaxID=1260987 RepID=UPI00188DCE42|nr:hypothetical protein [Noviherbaspirillum malthae]